MMMRMILILLVAIILLAVSLAVIWWSPPVTLKPKESKRQRDLERMLDDDYFEWF